MTAIPEYSTATLLIFSHFILERSNNINVLAVQPGASRKSIPLYFSSDNGTRLQRTRTQAHTRAEIDLHTVSKFR